MSRLVIDTSVAVKWFLSEPYSADARRILDGNHELLAPDLLLPEFGNVLWKRARAGEMTGDGAAAVLTALLDMPLSIREPGPLIIAALDIANRTQRTVYDGLYLALAVSESAVLVTADERLFNSTRGTPLEAHVAWVGDIE